ncbi:leucine-rich repeat-containing protein 59-like [Sorghum bicolor]|nr:leucine-rich repeat-containing protein 59-like [Sorghum bicolor]XP_021306156.1 leucine-rich repeat-containing protein 59-like [Sorghum bicolor]XP_021307429.1 leucine-rich repeat-containing protein 59-like [Sorghum bicolor]XP_021307466.1 leucine-rich repeat-containing protein 59-like [Sorghum bicolor]OQU78090.1 hypothetical protein SORBI_3009G152180 [Sorghum bicolor]OQU89947.1 hypothetical protein SORBI_3002G300950 [Sorghum bicolor]|eukprot:XP_021306130.1 leucine-rich repeat-containing protein 59-like [Sorghum bicolor]
MCFCGDPCKVEISEDEETYRQRYWMCSNFAWEPTPKQRRSNFITPPPLCDFEQWIDTEVKESDKRLLQGLKEWDAERAEILEKRRREEAQKREHKEEEERRRVAAAREEREKKLERVRRAKAAIDENPDAQRKGKWPRCTQ